MPAVLEARNVSKRFRGTQALQHVDFSLEEGEVHALTGENGAGKSTLAKIFAGVVTPDTGKIFVAGKRANIRNPSEARKLGIGIVFQELDLFPQLTVAENMAIANAAAGEGGAVQFRKLNSWCRGFLEQVKLDVSPDARLSSLSIGQVQRVAIARALSMNAQVILLDEPTSSLSDDAVEMLFALVAQLKKDGVAFVYVSHKMTELRRIADRVTVLRDGARIGTSSTNALSTDDLIAMMIGRKLEQKRRPERKICADVILEIEGLSTGFLSGLNVQVRSGEVLGVAGLVGAGRSELGKTLFGLRSILSGKISLNGRAFRPAGPADAIRRGFCLLPEDRRWEGSFPQMSVLENATIAALDRLRAARLSQEEASRFGPFQHLLHLSKAPKDSFSTLSGGNQQKVILARWLMVEPSVLFLDEPTRGIDVGAKEQIHGLIDGLASQGKAVILASSELPELWRCCDRILVLHEGRQSGIVRTADATQEEVLRLATGMTGQMAQA